MAPRVEKNMTDTSQAWSGLRVPDWFWEQKFLAWQDELSAEIKIDNINIPSVSILPDDEISTTADPIHPVKISKDLYAQLQDVTAAVVGQQSDDVVVLSPIVLATRQDYCGHVTRAIMIKLAHNHQADLVVLQFEDLLDLADDFNDQLEAREKNKKPIEIVVGLNLDDADASSDLELFDIIVEPALEVDTAMPLEEANPDTAIPIGNRCSEPWEAREKDYRCPPASSSSQKKRMSHETALSILLKSIADRRSPSSNVAHDTAANTSGASRIFVMLDTALSYNGQLVLQEVNFMRSLLKHIAWDRRLGIVSALFNSTTIAARQEGGFIDDYDTYGDDLDREICLARAAMIKIEGEYGNNFHVTLRAALRQLERAVQLQLRSLSKRSNVNVYHRFSLDELDAIYAHRSAFDRSTDTFDRCVLQLVGRACRQESLDTSDFIEVIRRTARTEKTEIIVHSDPWSELGIDVVSDKTEEELRARIQGPDDLEETLEDVCMDVKKLRMVRNLVKLSLMPRHTLPATLGRRSEVPGLMLYGPTGTGKTQLVKAIAKSMGANLLVFEAVDFTGRWIDAALKRISKAFTVAYSQPCILFFDQVEVMLYKGSTEDHRHEKKVLSRFTSELKSLFSDEAQVMVIMATNRLKDVHKTVFSRFMHCVEFQLPDVKAREQLLKLYMRDRMSEQLEGDETCLEEVAHVTDGYSGLDLRHLYDRAVLLAITDTDSGSEEQRDKIHPRIPVFREHFIEALQNASWTVAAAAERALMDAEDDSDASESDC